MEISPFVALGAIREAGFGQLLLVIYLMVFCRKNYSVYLANYTFRFVTQPPYLSLLLEISGINNL